MSVSARGDKMDSVLLVRDLIQLSRWLAASDGLCSQPAINIREQLAIPLVEPPVPPWIM